MPRHVEAEHFLLERETLVVIPATVALPDTWYDMVRPGVALYGTAAANGVTEEGLAGGGVAIDAGGARAIAEHDAA